MFEEIKGLLTSIDKKVNERVTVNPSPSETKTDPKSDDKINMVKLGQLLQFIAAHLQETERKIGQFSDAIKVSEKHVLFQMEEIKRITVSQKPDSKVRHHHIIDLRSSKVVITIVCLSVFLLASLFGNIHQFEVNSRMTDNDLKYRYIKSTNGISPENLDKLEDIFHYNRDKKLIREISTKVEEYEHKIDEVSQKLVHSRMNESNPRN